jgi:hypothetical protein
MKTHILRPALTALAFAGALAFAVPATAAVTTYKATLTSAAEVPPNDSKGTGTVTATFDDATKKLSWKGTYANLSGTATAAHFHGPAEPGKNAGVLIPVFAGATAKSPFEGEAVLTDAQASDLAAGRLYFNIHTDKNKGGELRGQVTK